MKPGVIPLRPLGLGEILDGAISCARAYPRTTFGLSAVVATATQIVLLVVSWLMFRTVDTSATSSLGPNPTPEEFSRWLDQTGPLLSAFLAVLLVTLVLGVLAGVMLTGLLTVVVSRAVIGQSVTVGDAWAAVRPRFLRLVGLSLLVSVVPFLALFACIAPGVYLWALWGLATPALILERQKVFGAMSRSARLVTGSWWRVFLILLLTWFLVGVITYVVTIPFQLIGGGNPLDPTADPDRALSFFALSMNAIGSIIAGTITAPFAAGVTVLLYVDQRMRREGLDLELARAAGISVPGQPAAAAQSAGPQDQQYGAGQPQPYGSGQPPTGPGQPPQPPTGPPTAGR